MAGSSSTRSKALKALKRLIAVPRPTGSDSPADIFHFGILPASFFEGKPATMSPKFERPPEEHRSIVLVIAAVMDQALEGAILAKLPGIKAGNEGYIFSDDAAPLRDFDAKIRIGFALGLFGEKARSDLSLMRAIRNTFAHSRLDISFETPEVAQACSHFTLTTRKPAFVNEETSCQTFIDVGWTYAIYLIANPDPHQPDNALAAEILDILPSPERRK